MITCGQPEQSLEQSQSRTARARTAKVQAMVKVKVVRRGKPAAATGKTAAPTSLTSSTAAAALAARSSKFRGDRGDPSMHGGGPLTPLSSSDPLHSLHPRVLAGDQYATTEFHRLILPHLHSVAWKYLRNFPDEHEDFCQVASAQIFFKLGQWRGGSKLSVWVYAVARSRALMMLRQWQSPSAAPDDPRRTDSLDQPIAGLVAGHGEMRQRVGMGRTVGEGLGRAGEQAAVDVRIDLDWLLGGLSPSLAATLRGRAEGKTYSEMARERGLSVGTLKAYAVRGLDQARRALAYGEVRDRRKGNGRKKQTRAGAGEAAD